MNSMSSYCGLITHMWAIGLSVYWESARYALSTMEAALALRLGSNLWVIEPPSTSTHDRTSEGDGSHRRPYDDFTPSPWASESARSWLIPCRNTGGI